MSVSVSMKAKKHSKANMQPLLLENRVLTNDKGLKSHATHHRLWCVAWDTHDNGCDTPNVALGVSHVMRSINVRYLLTYFMLYTDLYSTEWIVFPASHLLW